MATLGTLLIVLAGVGQNAPAEPGTAVAFRLQDFRGASHSLDDVRDRKLVVLAFLGVECPLANQYAPRLVELARAFEPKGVAFFGIDANQQDGVAAMGRFSNENGLAFPFLKDVGNELADLLKVERTPEVIVLDAKRAIRIPGSHRRSVRAWGPPIFPVAARPVHRAGRIARRARGLDRQDGARRLSDQPVAATG